MKDTKFSEQLITEITLYFHNHYNLNLNPEQAEEYLDSLADLFLAFANLQKDKNNQ